MYCNGCGVCRITVLNGCARRTSIGSVQGIAVLLARPSCCGAIVTQKIVQAENNHAPHALSGSQVYIGETAVCPQRHFTDTWLLEAIGAWFDKVARPVENQFAVDADCRH